MKPSALLLVEDDYAVRALFIAWLREAWLGKDTPIYEATSIESAIKGLHAFPDIRMILLDMRLEDCTDLRGIKEILPVIHLIHGPPIPIVMTSAFFTPQDRLNALLAGADDTVEKDANIPRMREKLLESVQRSWLAYVGRCRTYEALMRGERARGAA